MMKFNNIQFIHSGIPFSPHKLKFYPSKYASMREQNVNRNQPQFRLRSCHRRDPVQSGMRSDTFQRDSRQSRELKGLEPEDVARS